MKNIKINNPIFIIGAPRSGTTLLYNILCKHHHLSYITLNLLRAGIHRKGRILGYKKNTLAKIYDVIYKDKASNAPHEANNFWDKYFGMYDYLTEKDFQPEMVDHYKLLIHNVEKFYNVSRFINKNPQHSMRVRLLYRIFNEIKFIHIIRDGRAASYSMIKKIEKEPNDSYSISIQNKILKQYYRQDRSKLYNYGLAWQIIVNKAREANEFGHSRYYELRYEDLIQRPVEIISEILNFCNLDIYDEFIKSIPDITNKNVKWMQELSEEEKIDVEESTALLRKELNYK